MPDPQPPRPGLARITESGREWEAAKLSDLAATFGTGVVLGTPSAAGSGLPAVQQTYTETPLENLLPGAPAGSFLVEAEYPVGNTFEQALGIQSYRGLYSLDYAKLRPDIIQVLPPGTFSSFIGPDGRVAQLSPSDGRRQLRVIDIKLTAEASVGHFTEVVYYCLTLAGWLVDQAMDDFVVVPNAALWPGSHDASNLVRLHSEMTQAGQIPSIDQLRAALATDIEEVPFEVLIPRVKRFLQEEIPEVLGQHWSTQPWHVDNRCKGCEYLGQSMWTNAAGVSTASADHCMPEAQRIEHLSRVAFISRGASSALRDQNVSTVSDLAALTPGAAAFGTHQTLRATRMVVPSRAGALQTNQASVPLGVGTSAMMPSWADLRVYVSTDFDIGSAITMAFGLEAFWREPRTFGAPTQPPHATQAWRATSYVVDARDLATERRELISFLTGIEAILADVRARDAQRVGQPHYAASTVQFYIWDQLQFEHLARVIGRHLPNVLSLRGLAHLAWLFPPEELLPNAATVTTRRSHVTVVRDVIRPLLAAPVPHYYSLLEVARSYHDPRLQGALANFRVHPHFEDPLSDQIPSERAHEIWGKVGPPRPWGQQVIRLQETIATKLRALAEVVRRLETDLRPSLTHRAPEIGISPPNPVPRASVDGQLWYGFAKLDQALREQDVQQTRASPPEEREARFRSARLERRLVGAAEAAELARLGHVARSGRRVYRLRPDSREAKIREGDFTFALAPEAIAGFLDHAPRRELTQATFLASIPQWVRRMETLTQVTVLAMDREGGVLVVEENNRFPGVLDNLERDGVNLSTNVILDPTETDFFTRKLMAALQAIGNPPRATANGAVLQATGISGARRIRSAPDSPAAEVLWGAAGMALTSVARQLPPVKAALEAAGMSLNQSQWDAWAGALQRRIQLIWGPPGTGKSRTLQAVIAGAIVEAQLAARPLRVLLSGPTYNAIDNVLEPTLRLLASLTSPVAFEAHRLRSYIAPAPASPTLRTVDRELNWVHPTPEVQALRQRLSAATGITIVSATAEQTHNLLIADGGSPMANWFDLIVVDEASQLDVAHAILPLTSLAANGALVVAGDSKQLPPIHSTEAPAGLEPMVGSFYGFLEDIHHLDPKMLEENYRSNHTIVEYSMSAGYRPTLTSFSPQLRLDLLTPLPTQRPSDWPNDLYWTPDWAALLDPAYPATCFVYAEGRSSQWNQFEADAVAALIWMLNGRLADQLLNENDPNAIPTATFPRSTSAYTTNTFWKQAVGVVTPHKAQQGLVISRLQRLFVPIGVGPGLIRDAVDTVERFQGQQRDVIIATFALGDPDAIREEEEFLMSLNRFNVMASRARAKLIVLVSREVVDHLADEIDVLRESRMLKLYAETFCGQRQAATLGWVDAAGVQYPVTGSLRRRP